LRQLRAWYQSALTLGSGAACADFLFRFWAGSDPATLRQSNKAHKREKKSIQKALKVHEGGKIGKNSTPYFFTMT
jgi:hypothetical protein